MVCTSDPLQTKVSFITEYFQFKLFFLLKFWLIGVNKLGWVILIKD